MADTPDAPIDLKAPATLEDIIRLISASGGAQNEQLVNAFAEAMARNAPKRKITIGEYDPKTWAHPNKAKAVKLTRPFLICGVVADEGQLHDSEVALMNRIDRSGRYLDRLVEVIVRDEGVDEMVEIRWAARTTDQRNAHAAAIVRLPGDVSGFAAMMRQIVEAQQVEEKEMLAAGQAPVKRRSFGDTAAFREATARRIAREARENGTEDHPTPA